MTPMEKPEDKIIPNPKDALEFKPVKRSRLKRSGLKHFMVFFLLCGFAGFGWFFYGDHLRHHVGDQLPVVRAIEGPVKVRPKTPGGMPIPDRDKLVYGRINGGVAEPRVERLLPLPEIPKKPLSLKIKPDPMPRLNADSSKTQTPVEKSYVLPTPNIEKSKVNKKKHALPVTTSNSNSGSVSTLKNIQDPKISKEKAPISSPKPSSMTVSSSTQTPVSGIAYQVQIAAVRSRERAVSEWTRLKQLHGDLLEDYSLNVVRVDLGSTKGIFYRLRAGPIAWEDVAKSLCKNLIKRKVGCLIVRPGG